MKQEAGEQQENVPSEDTEQNDSSDFNGFRYSYAVTLSIGMGRYWGGQMESAR